MILVCVDHVRHQVGFFQLDCGVEKLVVPQQAGARAQGRPGISSRRLDMPEVDRPGRQRPTLFIELTVNGNIVDLSIDDVLLWSERTWLVGFGDQWIGESRLSFVSSHLSLLQIKKSGDS